MLCPPFPFPIQGVGRGRLVFFGPLPKEGRREVKKGKEVGMGMGRTGQGGDKIEQGKVAGKVFGAQVCQAS